MKKPNRKVFILEKLYTTGLRLTATDFKISNANQFLVELESQGFIKREWVKKEGETPFKLAYITNKTREEAKKYLIAFNRIKSTEDEVQES